MTLRIHYKQLIAALFLIVLTSTSSAQDVRFQHIGFGARSSALANNCVALSSDQSVMYYNPGAMGFIPIREFSFGVNGLTTASSASDGATSGTASFSRVHLSQLGGIWALPVSQGGASCAFGFNSPYTADETTDLTMNIKSGSTNIFNKAFGQLNYFTGAFGIQVAPGLGVGGAVSFLIGSGYRYFGITDSSNSWADTYIRRYVGVGIRGGILYKINEINSLGLRIVLPQTLGFSGTLTDSTRTVTLTEDDPGLLTSPLSGAFGYALSLPFLLISSELRATTPNPTAPINSFEASFKVGGGGGVEIPIGKSLILRGGYSYDEYDPSPFTYEYSIPRVSDPSHLTILKNQTTLSAGAGFILQSNVSLDIGYSTVSYELQKSSYSQKNTNQRVNAQFSIRY